MATGKRKYQGPNFGEVDEAWGREEKETAELVRSMSPEDRFWYWCRERYQIYLRRRAGKTKPWTPDPILRRYYFTHPYRELDKVTVWFRENIRDPLRDDPRVIFATIAFRWFNLPSTGRILIDKPKGIHARSGDLLKFWDMDECFRRLNHVREQGGKVFTGAYMIKSPPGEPKLEAICRCINDVWEDRKDLIKFTKTCTRMEDMQARLRRYYGLGGFMCYEIVCDLRYTRWLEDATDKLTWCNPGPGCRRGLHRLRGGTFDNNSGSPPLPKDWLQTMQELLKQSRGKLRGMPRFEMREVEHSLCEVDKFSRLLLGEGRSKRLYDARG